MKAKLVKESLNEALRYQGQYWRDFAEELVDYHGWKAEGNEVYKYDMNDETEKAEKTTLSKGYDDNINYIVTDEEGNEIDSGEFDAEGLSSGELDGELYYNMNESLNESMGTNTELLRQMVKLSNNSRLTQEAAMLLSEKLDQNEMRRVLDWFYHANRM